jgi:hypothetical protein
MLVPALLIALPTTTTHACAQSAAYPASQRGSVTQSVAYTSISIVYGRPVARGRALFGSLVPWDAIWHPGADSATRMTFNHDLVINGKTLRAGEYTLWLIPREHSPWSLIFSRAAHVFHKPYPGEQYEVMRVEATPIQASDVESLTIYFPKVLRDEAEMRIQWGTMALPVQIKAPYEPK